MDRPSGYYWVRCTCGEWNVALWESDGWTQCGDGGLYQDGQFREIGPRIPLPDEPSEAAEQEHRV